MSDENTPAVHPAAPDSLALTILALFGSGLHSGPDHDRFASPTMMITDRMIGGGPEQHAKPSFNPFARSIGGAIGALLLESPLIAAFVAAAANDPRSAANTAGADTRLKTERPLDYATAA